jgi:predicted Zn-dependent peptidase
MWWAPISIAATVLSLVCGCSGGRLVAPLRYEPDPAAPDERFRATMPSASPVMPAVALPWRERTLDNGLRVVHLERRGAPIVSVRLVVARGHADAAAALDTYSILEELMQTGTAHRTARQLANEYAFAGGVWGTSFGPDSCSIVARGAAARFDDIVALVAETALQPRFSQPALATVRERWIADFASSRTNGELALARNASTLLFGRYHPYGFPVPHEAHARAIRLEDVAALHDRLFQPAHAALVVVGDVSAASVDAAAARQLGAWRAKAPPLARPPVPLPPAEPARVVLVPLGAQAQVQVTVAAKVPPLSPGQLAALDVLAASLGGLSAPLRNHVRDAEAAAYVFDAETVRMRGAYLFLVGGSIERGKVDATVRAVLGALDLVRRSGIHPQVAADAKAALIARWRARASTNDGLASLVEATLARGGELGEVAAVPKLLDAVTPEDIRGVAGVHLGAENLRVVVVGDHFAAAATQWRDGFANPLPP